MPTAFANHAAAVTAGYKSILLDNGALAPDPTARYEVTLEKHLVGGIGRSGGLQRAHGVGSSQAAAETRALAALEGMRNYRYGNAAAGGSLSQDGAALTVDVS